MVNGGDKLGRWLNLSAADRCDAAAEQLRDASCVWRVGARARAPAVLRPCPCAWPSLRLAALCGVRPAAPSPARAAYVAEAARFRRPSPVSCAHRQGEWYLAA
eukprot:scaffold35568_cov152-Isochrysis_galbana.AAC.2